MSGTAEPEGPIPSHPRRFTFTLAPAAFFVALFPSPPAVTPSVKLVPKRRPAMRMALGPGLAIAVVVAGTAFVAPTRVEAQPVFFTFGGEKTHKIADFPDTEEFRTPDRLFGQFVDAGVIYKQITIFFLPLWNYDIRWAGYIPNSSQYVPLTRSELEELATRANVSLPLNPELPLWDRIGGKLILALLLVILWLYRSHYGHDDEPVLVDLSDATRPNARTNHDEGKQAITNNESSQEHYRSTGPAPAEVQDSRGFLTMLGIGVALLGAIALVVLLVRDQRAELPSCGDTEATGLVRTIFAEETDYTATDVRLITTTDHNPNTGNYACSGEIVDNEGDRWNVEYTIGRDATDPSQFIVRIDWLWPNIR